MVLVAKPCSVVCRIIWDHFQKPQIISYAPKHWFWCQNHAFSMLRSCITPQVRISHLEVLLDLLQPHHPVLVLQVNLRLLKMVQNDSPYPKTICFDTRTMFLASSKAELLPKLEFHILKSLLTSYSPTTQYLSFRSIWGILKWSQMIPHTPKHWFCHQNHVSSMLRSWVTIQVRILLLEVLLHLLQPLHPVLVLQVNLRPLKMVPTYSP